MDMGLDEIEIVPCTEELVKKNMDQLLLIDQSHFTRKAWDEIAFSSYLPEKFEKSYLVVEKEKVLAYCFISKKPSSYHIHKFVVAKNSTSRGLGSKFLEYLFWEMVGQTITLKVQVSNFGAINFYLRNGFVFQGRNDEYYEMSKNGK
jgi:ribosomal protein S18 acetylase RimI-like enzyme